MTSVLQYALWPSLTFAMLALWTFGILDIDRHRRRGTSTSAGLLCMAGCVSLVAIFAISGIGATFGGQWSEAVSSATVDGAQTKRQEGVPPRAYLFSFGLGQAPDSSPADPGTQRGPGPRG